MDEFERWKDEYALYAERDITEADCLAAFKAGREAGMREAAKSCFDRIGVYSTESFERNAGANEALHEVGNAILSAIGGGK